MSKVGRSCIAAVVLLSACGGGGGSTPAPTPTTTFTIGGTVTGLVGTGLVLQNNGANNLAISANGTFTFATPLASGAAYAVTVLTQPGGPAQICTVTSGVGTASANVATVAINCPAPTYTIGGTITGLTGSGFVLQNNAGGNLAVATNGSFVFATALATGSTYTVTVLTQPSAQNCTIASATGTVAQANIASVAITCVALVFKATVAMKTARAMHSATLLQNGQVLVAGGVGTTNFLTPALDTAELYDPIANTFTAIAGRMTSVRNQHTATLLANGQVLITGGSNSGDGDGMNSAELYNPGTQTFTALTGTLKTPRGGHAAALLPNGQVLLTGGFFNMSTSHNSAELYNPVTQTFTTITPTMASRRSNHAAAALASGQVVIIGGTDDPPSNLNTVEIYDPVANSFTARNAAMSTVRGLPTATLLTDGQVLIAGSGTVSITNFIASNTAELYNPVTNTFTALAATLTTPRGAHAATLLGNGTVLLTGGGTGANSPLVLLSSAEVYGP